MSKIPSHIKLQAKEIQIYLRDHGLNHLLQSGYTVDLGCGRGDLLARLGELYQTSSVGIDRDPSIIRQARQIHPNIDFRVANVTETELPDSSSGVVTSSNVLDYSNGYLSDDLSVPMLAGEIERILIQGGYYFCFDPSLSQRHVEILQERGLTLVPYKKGSYPAVFRSER